MSCGTASDTSSSGEATDAVDHYTSIYSGAVLSSGATQSLGTVASAASGGERFYSNYDPAVAAAGTSFLVVWSYEDPTASGARNLYGARLDGEGSQEPTFAVSKAAENQTTPTIAFNGYFIVIWQDRRNGSDDLWGARIVPNGTVQDPNGFLVTEYYPRQREPGAHQGQQQVEDLHARLGGQTGRSGQRDHRLRHRPGPEVAATRGRRTSPTRWPWPARRRPCRPRTAAGTRGGRRRPPLRRTASTTCGTS